MQNAYSRKEVQHYHHSQIWIANDDNDVEGEWINWYTGEVGHIHIVDSTITWCSSTTTELIPHPHLVLRPIKRHGKDNYKEFLPQGCAMLDKKCDPAAGVLAMGIRQAL